MTTDRSPAFRKPTQTFILSTGELPEETEAVDRLRKLLEARGVHLPPLGGTAAKMHKLANDPRSTMDEVLKLIEHEPSLAMRVMRLANSAAMAAMNPATDLKRAVMRVGILGVRDMAFAMGMGAVIRATALKEDLATAYRHSYMVACGTHWACRAVGLDSAQGFLCGLMHDVGSLGALVTLAPHVAKDPSLGNAAALKTLLEEVHTTVGEEILSQWRLPSLVVTTARWHHRPDLAGAAEPLVRLVSAVDVAADKVAVDLNADPLPALLNTPELFVCGLNPPQIKELGRVLQEAGQDGTVESFVS